MTRYINQIIRDVRVLGNSVEYGTNYGISSEKCEILLNSAISKHYADIINTNKNVFIKDEVFTLTAGVDTYVLPTASAWNISILSVQEKRSETNYYPVRETAYQLQGQQPTNASNYSYHLENGNLVFSPKPRGTATFRIKYQESPPRLARKVATVDDITLEAELVVGFSYALTNTSNTVDDVTNEATFNNQIEKFINIVSPDGIRRISNLPYLKLLGSVISYPVNMNYDFTNIDTVQKGDYVCLGRMTTTHSPFPSETTPYLKAFVSEMIANTTPASLELQNGLRRITKDLETSILEMYLMNKDHSYPQDFLNSGGKSWQI